MRWCSAPNGISSAARTSISSRPCSSSPLSSMAVTCTIPRCCHAKGSAITPSAGVNRVRLQREFGMFDIGKTKIGVIGLGYEGLPLAVEFGKQLPVVGFDINKARIAELNAGRDSSLEDVPHELKAATRLSLTSVLAALEDCNFYISTVPSPGGRRRRPGRGPRGGAGH